MTNNETPFRNTEMRRKITLPYVHYADLTKMYGFGIAHETVWDALVGAIEKGYWEKFEKLLF